MAICDEDILDKEINNEGVKIRIKKEFYGDKKIDEDEAIELMKQSTISNFVGVKTIELAEKNGFIVKENIILIDDIPHAQFVKLK